MVFFDINRFARSERRLVRAPVLLDLFEEPLPLQQLEIGRDLLGFLLLLLGRFGTTEHATKPNHSGREHKTGEHDQTPPNMRCGCKRGRSSFLDILCSKRGASPF